MEVRSLTHDIRGTIARRGPLVVSVIVLCWSLMELISLGLTHTSGPEIYGVLTAALATGAAVANLALLRPTQTPVLATVAVVFLWALIAVGGIAGTVAHIIGPLAGHGPVDLRPRPVAAPLVFTLLGLVGGAALLVGRRAAIRHTQNDEKE